MFGKNKKPVIPKEDSFVPMQEPIEEESEQPVEEPITEEPIEVLEEEKVSFESILLNHDQRLTQVEAALLRIRGSI